MATKELRKAVKGRKTVSFDKKPQLRGTICDGCGLVHKMEEFCNDTNLGILSGTFDRSATDRDGRGLGNMFTATVCSFDCADKVMKGKWKDLKDYKPYVLAKANLVRCSVQVTSFIKTENELIKEWEEMEEMEYGVHYGVLRPY